MEFEVLPVTRHAMNCSILWCEDTMRAAVIDPGGDLSEIFNVLDLMDLEAEVALVTHGHFDHAGGAALFAERTGARIEGPHIADAPTVALLGELGKKYGVPARAYEPSRWLEHGDQMTLVHSIRHRLFPLGDDVRFVPGQHEQSTFGHERLHNPFVGEEAMRRWHQRTATAGQ